MPLCGAKTRNGGLCMKHALQDKTRCRLHGGASEFGGAPANNKNSVKPGSLYSRYLSEDEQAIAEKLQLGSIDEELRLTRIRLMRALAIEQEVDSNDPDSELHIESKSVEPQFIEGKVGTETNEQGEEVPINIVKRHYKRRDYPALIDRLTARIANLETQRATLAQNQLDLEKRKMENARLAKQADNIAVNVSNIMLVPHCTDVSQWETLAQSQQDDLLKGHHD